MAEQVAWGQGPKQGYEWDKWFDGHWWKLTKGVDFERPMERMRIGAFNQARKMGFKLTTRVDGDTLWIQAIPMVVAAQDRPEVSAGEVVQQPITTKRGRASKYPEEIWDGQPRAFYPGKDFQEGCQEGFRQAIRAAAVYRGIGVKTSVRADNAVIVQAVPKH